MPCDLYPGVVRSVDRGRREIRVEIPPLTDGASIWPLAEINYPIGDDSKDTEIRIVEGLPVNVSFHNGDPRYPVIMGYRNPHIGNEVGWRRWNHDNIEWNADKVVNINAGESINLVVGGTSIKLTSGAIKAIAQAVGIQGPVTQTGGDMTSDSISVQTHTHIEQGDGKAVSKPQ
jgi:hypothetical protein